MFRNLRPLHSLVKQHYSLSCTRYVHTAKTVKTSMPLRILFCGSDNFSIAGLKALYLEHKHNPNLIASIDVVCRPGKRTGRSLKDFTEVPIKSVATELGLPVHERDTFTGWTLPKVQGQPINLIVAVSFGLLVPPRILKGAEYGGINVHPSLLPDLHGPAPLQHALIAGDKHIGVSLQTLHPSEFDQGMVLDRTPLPGFPVPNPDTITVPQLLEFITPKAADMLLNAVRNKVFVPPVQKIQTLTPNHINTPPRHAPKITTADRRVNIVSSSTDELIRRNRVLRRLWTVLRLSLDVDKRLIFEDMTSVPRPKVINDAKYRASQRTAGATTLGTEPDSPESQIYQAYFVDENGAMKVFIYVRDENDAIIIPQLNARAAVRVEEITVEGEKKKPAFHALHEKTKLFDSLGWLTLIPF